MAKNMPRLRLPLPGRREFPAQYFATSSRSHIQNRQAFAGPTARPWSLRGVFVVAAAAGALGWGVAQLQKDQFPGSQWSVFGTGPARKYATVKELEKVRQSSPRFGFLSDPSSRQSARLRHSWERKTSSRQTPKTYMLMDTRSGLPSIRTPFLWQWHILDQPSRCQL